MNHYDRIQYWRTYPNSELAIAIASTPSSRDAWDNPVRIDATESGFCVRSAGEDGNFGTDDDVQFPE